MNKLMKNISFTKNETKVILFVITILVMGFLIKFYKQILNSPSLRFDYTAEDSVFKSLSEKKIIQGKNSLPDSLNPNLELNENNQEGILNIKTAKFFNFYFTFIYIVADFTYICTNYK